MRSLLAWEMAIAVGEDQIDSWTLCPFGSPRAGPRILGYTGTSNGTGGSRRL